MPSLTFERQIEADAALVFDLCRSIDFHVEAAKGIGGRAVSGRTSGLAGLGDTTTWSARFYRLRFWMTTTITHFSAPLEFDDSMTRGLFHHFSHRYRITDNGNTCVLEDTFTFQSPMGWLGKMVDAIVLSPALIRAQNERLDAIKNKAENN